MRFVQWPNRRGGGCQETTFVAASYLVVVPVSVFRFCVRVEDGD
jgi:hypothetical protein